ncbi:MAG: signal peptidase I [Armatimonadetes bacterium]|nr:signal peptidase I [Armatimonadota bacterium]
MKRDIAVPGDEIYIRPGYITVNGERWNHDDIRNAFADPDDSVKVKSDAVLVAGKRLTAGDLSRRFGGDREIEFHPGFVVRNGERVNEPYLAEDPDIAYPIVEPQLSEPGTYQSQRSVRKAISDGSLKMIRNSGPTRVKLGPGELLVMGDNRNRSSDSRFWGPLDRDRVMGRAMFVFWPISRIKWIR